MLGLYVHTYVSMSVCVRMYVCMYRRKCVPLEQAPVSCVAKHLATSGLYVWLGYSRALDDEQATKPSFVPVKPNTAPATCNAMPCVLLGII
jgi:hypothetical protein